MNVPKPPNWNQMTYDEKKYYETEYKLRWYKSTGYSVALIALLFAFGVGIIIGASF